MDSKECTKCNTAKPISEFFPLYGKERENGARNGRTHRSWCKSCNGKSGTEFKRQNPEARKRYSNARRKYRIASKYGLTEARYFEILKEQGGHCAICPRTDGRKKQKTCTPTKFHFAVDHDHDTGLTRGLLCGTCNRALGMFGDNPDNLRSAVAYLARHGKT